MDWTSDFSSQDIAAPRMKRKKAPNRRPAFCAFFLSTKVVLLIKCEYNAFVVFIYLTTNCLILFAICNHVAFCIEKYIGWKKLPPCRQGRPREHFTEQPGWLGRKKQHLSMWGGGNTLFFEFFGPQKNGSTRIYQDFRIPMNLLFPCGQT